MQDIKHFEFSRHLWGAIKLNALRSVRYSKLSHMKSAPLSCVLISSELLTLPIAVVSDLWALRYQKRGIPLFSQEFIDMGTVSDFKEREERSPLNYSIDEALDLRVIKQLTSRKDIDALSRELERSIQLLEEPYFPMHRHILESMLRALDAYSSYLEHHEDRTLHNLSYRLVRSHLLSIPLAKAIDRMANPLIQQGIPIVFQDLPVIPRLAIAITARRT